jgi:hypothetical protein
MKHKNTLFKTILHFVPLISALLVLTSCSFSFQRSNNNINTISYHNQDFPAQNFESLKILMDSTNAFQSDTFKIDSNCVIQYIDLKHLQEMAEKTDGPVFIYIWGSIVLEKGIDFSELVELNKIKNMRTFIISSDVGTDTQINILRKFLTAKGYLDTSYIIYQKFNVPNDIVNEFKTYNFLTNFINSIDTVYHSVLDTTNKIINIPYAIMLNKNKEIIYRNNDIDINEINDLVNNQEITDDKILMRAFAGVAKNPKNNAENISKSLVFYGIPAAYHSMDISIPDSVCKVSIVTPKDFKKILNQNRGSKILIHIWGLWCQYAALGILDIKELLPTDTANYKLLLINADMNTEGQIDLVRKFLFSNGINIPIYFIKNQFDSMEELPDFIKMQHLIDFIEVFDKDYKNIAIPYTIILDEKGNIIYKRAVEPQPEDLAPTDINKVMEKTDSVKREYGTMEIQKIKEILRK